MKELKVIKMKFLEGDEDVIVNSVCITCDNRLRLKKCNGICSDFNYCFRPSGNVDTTQAYIGQFNTLNELDKLLINWIDDLDVKTKVIDKNYCKYDSHISMVLCKYKEGVIGVDKDYLYPVGWIYY